MFKFNNRNTGKKCETCSKWTIKTLKRRHQLRCSGVFIVKFEHISHFFLGCFCWLWTSKYLLGKNKKMLKTYLIRLSKFFAHWHRLICFRAWKYVGGWITFFFVYRGICVWSIHRRRSMGLWKYGHRGIHPQKIIWWNANCKYEFSLLV